MKIAVVGGGSTYTPELVEGFARLLPDADLHLVDPAAERLAVVGPFARRLNPRVTWTTDPDEGLDGADVVVIQLRVGGQRARIHDETFPLRCGCVGQETTGAGGLANATPPAAPPASRRWGRSPATGAAASTWPRWRCTGRRAARTAGTSRPR